MYGGDWPIAVLAGGYTRVWEGLQPLFDGLEPQEREQVLGRTARSSIASIALVSAVNDPITWAEIASDLISMGVPRMIHPMYCQTSYPPDGGAMSKRLTWYYQG